MKTKELINLKNCEIILAVMIDLIHNSMTYWLQAVNKKIIVTTLSCTLTSVCLVMHTLSVKIQFSAQ